MTKLYGGDKRLYTAAEARRIDIERGGSGKIVNFYTTEKLSGDHFNQPHWFPHTAEPSPEPERLVPIKSITLEEVLEIYPYLKPTPAPEAEKEEVLVTLKGWLEKSEKIEQLEKELAELKEKARWKSCKEEKPDTSKDVLILDRDNEVVGLCYYEGEHSQKWYHKNGGYHHSIVLADHQIENWTWKYEEDL